MKEKLSSIYGNKAPLYLDVLNALEKQRIKYTLLSVLVSDDNPGDLDVLVSKDTYNGICNILSVLGFSYYTKYETDQYLWNKYAPSIGFVQVHCYLSFSFQGKDYLKGYNFIGDETYSPTFQFYVFLVESFYKSKRRDSQYDTYLQLVTKEDLLRFSYCCPLYGQAICNQMLSIYEEKLSIQNSSSMVSLGNRLVRCFLRLFNKKDRRILFIGVDGAGKTSIIEGVNRICAKGGIYPMIVYLGLRESIFNRKEKWKKEKAGAIENKESKHVEQENHNKRISIRDVKVLLYWAEYNTKYLLRTCVPNSAPTVYLIDRCYIDLLRYYPSSFARWLLLKVSLYPRKVVFLTGNEKELFERKREFSESVFSEICFFYNDMAHSFKKKRGNHLLTVDTTAISLDESIVKVCDFIMDV